MSNSDVLELRVYSKVNNFNDSLWQPINILYKNEIIKLFIEIINPKLISYSYKNLDCVKQREGVVFAVIMNEAGPRE